VLFAWSFDFDFLLVGSVLLSQERRSFSPFPQKTADPFVGDGKIEVWGILVFVNQVQAPSFGCREGALTVQVKAHKDTFPSVFLNFCNRIVTLCLMEIKESRLRENAIAALGGTDISMAGRIM